MRQGSIPDCAWSWPIGAGFDPPPRVRVATPMIDDGPWAGAPIGGIGAGSLGRTQRGEFARRHLAIGEHAFDPAPSDGFALRVAGPDARSAAVLLRTSPGLPGWGPGLAPGASGSYRALFPRAWFDYDLGAALDGLPLRVVEEQLAPFVPGDEGISSLPVGVFAYVLENEGPDPLDVTVLLSWRDELRSGLGGPPSEAEAFVVDGAVGVAYRSPDGAEPGTFAIAAAADDAVEVSTARFGPDGAGDVWETFASDGRVHDAPDGTAAGFAAVAARRRVAPGETAIVRFALAWDLPTAVFGSGRRWRRRYTREWGTSGSRGADLAAHALRRQDGWRAAIEAWQAPVLDAADRPGWYKAALFNELYFLLDGGTIWPAGGPDPGVDGATVAELGILECYDYPFYDTLDVHFYAAFALTALFPRLQATISRAYAATVGREDRSTVTIEASGETAVRKVAGALPHDLGGPSEDPLVRVNHYRFQAVNDWKDLNAKFVLQAWRDRGFDPDPEDYLRATWPAVERAMDHLAGFDRDGDGLPEHDGRPDQTYDTWPMRGPSAYGGSLWLAALRAAAAHARAVGQDGRAVGWDACFERARASFIDRLWNGRSFDYDGGGGASSTSVMADQLAGQWYADVLGLGDLLPADQVASALRHVHELNVVGFADGTMGAVNGMRRDGTVDTSSEQSQEVWVGTSYALAAFMIGRGLAAEGWETARGAARVVWERGLWFRTPEAFDRNGDFRASLYLRPLAIWAIEEALSRPGRVR